MQFAELILAQADTLAGFSDEAGEVTRCYMTPAHRAAAAWLAEQMSAAGLAAHVDAAGNVIGRLAGANPAAASILVGSHYDSVRNAGRYDGPLGILCAIAALGALARSGEQLARPIEVVAFAEEEGTRFGVTMLGSSAIAGCFDPAWLDARDADGVSLAQCLQQAGTGLDAVRRLDRRALPPHAYLEMHIEQGPVLLSEGLPLGVVTGIAGATRLRCDVGGLGGHSGTVPMTLRRDALVATAEMILAVERVARATEGLVATVGELEIERAAANVIPGHVRFSIDVRHIDDAVRERALAAIDGELVRIAGARSCSLGTHLYYQAAAAACDGRLQAMLGDELASMGLAVRHLPSGAGHDAMVMARLCPMAMMFVRCGNGGISHHPDEIVTAADVELATVALQGLLRRVAMADLPAA